MSKKYEVSFERYASMIIVGVDSQIDAEEKAMRMVRDGAPFDIDSGWEQVDETVELGTEA